MEVPFTEAIYTKNVMHLRVVFIKARQGTESVENLRETFRENIRGEIGTEIDNFLQHCILVTE